MSFHSNAKTRKPPRIILWVGKKNCTAGLTEPLQYWAGLPPMPSGFGGIKCNLPTSSHHMQVIELLAALALSLAQRGLAEVGVGKRAECFLHGLVVLTVVGLHFRDALVNLAVGPVSSDDGA